MGAKEQVMLPDDDDRGFDRDLPPAERTPDMPLWGKLAIILLVGGAALGWSMRGHAPLTAWIGGGLATAIIALALFSKRRVA